MNLIHDPKIRITEASQAQEMLVSGNKRYVNGKMVENKDYTSDRYDLSKDQNPFSVVICCSDSRVSPEFFFDQELGDIFVIRNAGNVVDETVLGSLEYAVEHLECPLIVVCGHSKCGAVTAACDKSGAKMSGTLQTIIDRIIPATEIEVDVEAVIHKNVELMVNIIKDNPIVKQYKSRVVGALYDIDSGIVKWDQLT